MADTATADMVEVRIKLSTKMLHDLNRGSALGVQDRLANENALASIVGRDVIARAREALEARNG